MTNMAKSRPSVSSKNMQIQKASTQTFIAVTIAAVVVAMALVALNFLWGTAKYNDKVQSRQEEARDTLESNVEVIPDLEEAYRVLELSGALTPDQEPEKENAEVILDALPTKFDFAELAASMENLAKKSSVQLEGFSGVDEGSDASVAVPDPEPLPLPFSVNVSGEYTAVAKFMRGLENSIRPMKVVSVSLTGTSNRLQATFNIETSYQPAFDLNIQKEVVAE